MGYLNDVQFHSDKRMFVQKQIILYLNKYIHRAENFLDMGSGRGEFISQVRGNKLYAIDLDPQAANYLPLNVDFINGGVSRLSEIPSKSLDVIWASNFLEHLEMTEVKFFLSEANRLLRVAPQNGYLIVMQPNFRYSYKNYFDDHTHKTIFTHVSLTNVIKSAGFEIVVCEKKFLPYSLNSRKANFSFLVGIYLKSKIRIFGGQMLIIARIV